MDKEGRIKEGIHVSEEKRRERGREEIMGKEKKGWRHVQCTCTLHA